MISFRAPTEGFKKAPEPELRGIGMHFDAPAGKFRIALDNGGVYGVSPAEFPEFRDFTSEQLREVVLGYAGVYLHHPQSGLSVCFRDKLAPFSRT